MSNSNQPPSNKSKILEFLSDYWLIILMFILIIVAFSFAYYVVTIYQHTLQTVAPTSTDRADWGTTGDFFGGVLNPIFAFLGLIMLLATLFQSQRELSLTRKELELSRKAAEESEKALSDQALTQKQQRFENMFFALLEQHNEVAKILENSDFSFEKYKKTSHPIYEAKALLINNMKNPVELKRYFMVLHQILKHIYIYYSTEKNLELKNIVNYYNITIEEKSYADLLKAFVSNKIGCFILINCLPSDEQLFKNYPKMKALAERYQLFEHIDFNDLNHSLVQDFIKNNIYDTRAFGKNDQYHNVRTSLENQNTQ